MDQHSRERVIASRQPGPDCGQCMHYYITHDRVFPYGCRALGIKGKRKPCLDVLDASGEPCLAFTPKAKG